MDMKQIATWLSSNNRGWRLLVGLFCTICLAFFLHFREIRLEVLELNTAAPRYIVAQIDFEFPDTDTTLVLQQQAMQDIGPIYQIDEGDIRQAHLELEQQLIQGGVWRQRAPASTFEEMYRAADLLETTLLEARFTDPRTIQKIKELHFPQSFFYDADHTSLPANFWETIASQVEAQDHLHSETVAFLVESYEKRSWNLVEDSALVHTLRMQVRQSVPSRYTLVSAGTRIIDQGEVATPRHLAMMQAMKKAMSESRKLYDPLTIVASFLLAIIFVTISALYFRISQPTFIRSLQHVSLFVCIVVLTLLFAKGTEFAILKNMSNFMEAIRYPIVAPFATILICILLTPRTALFAATFLSIILSVSLAVDHSRFLVLNLVTSIVIIISTKGLRRRKDVFTVCLKSWGSAIPVLIAYSWSENQLWSGALFLDIGSSFVFLMIIAVLVIGLLPALETLFCMLTDMTLMEYMDPNNELLRRLAIEVPGTYQHSLVLGNLAEQCAQAIGANGLFCRAATLYHDIGKLMNPQFYTENQQGALNIHQLLTPLESAQVIIAHVPDGEMLGRKYGLPAAFIDIIREHHGTTLVYYFYRKQLELKGGRTEEVDERAFRYPGPKPRSKESAVIMICDTVEAASRSLEDVSEGSLRKLVERLMSEKGEEGQFDDCQLTFEEVTKIKNILVKSLLLAQHIRIKYPKRPEKSS